MRPPRLLALVLALVLGLAAAYATACGEEDRGLLTANKAESLRASLDDIDEAVASGRCERARAALDDLRQKLDTLPDATDRRLRSRLEQGAENLEDIAPGECTDNRTDTTGTETEPAPTTTETVPPETTPTETVPPETTPTETVPPETTPTEPVPTETVPPVEPVDPGGEGGTEAPAP